MIFQIYLALLDNIVQEENLSSSMVFVLTLDIILYLSFTYFVFWFKTYTSFVLNNNEKITYLFGTNNENNTNKPIEIIRNGETELFFSVKKSVGHVK